MAKEIVKDFHTGDVVPRFRVKPLARPCAGCGTPTNHYDSKYGWHVCVDCDPDRVAADYVRDVMSV